MPSLAPAPLKSVDIVRIAYSSFKDGFSVQAGVNALLSAAQAMVPIFGIGWTAYELLQLAGVIEEGTSATNFQKALLSSIDVDPEAFAEIYWYAKVKYDVGSKVVAGIALQGFGQWKPVGEDGLTPLQRGLREGKARVLRRLPAGVDPARVSYGVNEIGPSLEWERRYDARKTELAHDEEERARVVALLNAEFPQAPQGEATATDLLEEAPPRAEPRAAPELPRTEEVTSPELADVEQGRPSSPAPVLALLALLLLRL